MVSRCTAALFSLGLAPPLSPPFSHLPPPFSHLPPHFKSRRTIIINNNNNNVKHYLTHCIKRSYTANKSNNPNCFYQGHFGPVKVTASSMEGPPPGYRPNVGICLINSNNQVFVASRLDVPGAWQMPQYIDMDLNLEFMASFSIFINIGGVDEQEVPKDAAIRELREETGVSSAEILAE
ncbi:hypothetical protein KI387_019109, partial [Taxus chinensis]